MDKHWIVFWMMATLGKKLPNPLRRVADRLKGVPIGLVRAVMPAYGVAWANGCKMLGRHRVEAGVVPFTPGVSAS